MSKIIKVISLFFLFFILSDASLNNHSFFFQNQEGTVLFLDFNGKRNLPERLADFLEKTGWEKIHKIKPTHLAMIVRKTADKKFILLFETFGEKKPMEITLIFDNEDKVINAVGSLSQIDI